MCCCSGYVHSLLPHALQTFVERLRWVTEDAYMELLALGSCLPGPTSTQVPMARTMAT